MKSLVVLLLFSFSLAQANTELLRFGILPAKVSESNKSVAGAKLRIKAAEKKSGHFGRSFLPKLKVLGGYENFKTGTFDRTTQPYIGSELSVNIFHGGKDYLESQINSHES